MRRFLLLIAVALTLAVPGFAQPQGPDRQKHEQMMKEIHEFKLKFLAQEMDLKEDQQKRFFELYSKMSDERHAVMRETRRLEKKVKKDSNATEADYQALNNAINEGKDKIAQIEKRYDEQFSTFLSARQIIKMKEAEEKFREKMREMRGKKRPK